MTPRGFRYRESAITLTGPRRDWEALERKLGRGVPLERAADDAGIPLDEVEAWAKDRAAVARQPVQSAIGHAAIISALTHFQKILANPDDYDTSSIEEREGGGTVIRKPQVPVHIHAARELARLGLQLAKMEMVQRAPKAEKKGGEIDLFDTVTDPWAE